MITIISYLLLEHYQHDYSGWLLVLPVLSDWVIIDLIYRTKRD